MTDRFRPAKAIQEKELCKERAVPKSSLYKNKWAASVLFFWGGGGSQGVQSFKVPSLVPDSLFKDCDLHKVHSLDVPLVEMDVLSLNCWMTKFV